MKSLLKLLTLVLLVSTLLQAAAFEKVAKSRYAEVTFSSEKPLVVGNNTVTLQITKGSLDNTKVIFKSFMPAMPGMPAMKSEAKAEPLGEGKYRVNVNFAMGGTWQIQIIIIPKEGKKIRLKSSVNL